jgi:DUF1680 family protein
MTGPISRRALLGTTLASATVPWLLGPARALAALGAAAGERRLLEPFELGAVRLRPGEAADALAVNRRYLLALDPDRLLHMFRVTAGLPSSAEPLGGWEAPANELRGHFTGHYLSACALLNAQTGDAGALARGASLVAELARCQSALGTGYLSAFPEELFDRLRAGTPAWAPFYTLHKIMAGLYDLHTLGGNAEAWTVLEGMGRWTERWVQPIGADAMGRVLEREYGGMNEVLYNMAAVSGNAHWRELGDRFNRERILGPLADGHDELKGLHVNTTIPQIIGAARGYELGGDRRRHDAAEFFWHTVTERRAYVTGGTSNGEDWNSAPGVLATELSAYTQECCVTYNMQKLTRHVFAWTADPRAADYYERAYYNGILGVQHPADGQKLYYVPLQGGYWKLFGTPLHDFWCCTGSMAEAFAKLGDSIYFHDADNLYVNLFIPSQLDWRERGVRVTQDTRLPDEATSRFTIDAERPVRFALRVRAPYWADGGSARLNGAPLAGFASPSSYFVLDRTWRRGDTLEVHLPMRLHSEAMPDDPTVQAVLYGPLVLAARLGTSGLDAKTLRVAPTAPRTVPEYSAEPPVAVPEIVAASADPASWLEAIPGRPLEFRTRAGNPSLSFMPFNRLFDERYAVYLTVRPPKA